MLQIADAARPPLRLPLGPDTPQVLDALLAERAADTRAWRNLSASTDFAQPAVA